MERFPSTGNFFISPGEKGKTISLPNLIPSLPEKGESPASLWSPVLWDSLVVGAMQDFTWEKG